MKHISDRSFYKKFKRFLTEGPAEDFSDIIDLPVDQFVKRFQSLSQEPEVQALIQAGKKDGNPSDEVIRFTATSIPVQQLRPTQNEIGMDESLQSILTDKFNTVDMILRGGTVKIKGPILVLNDEWIIDGHHRWSQVYVTNPDCKIEAISMKANIDPLDALKAVQMAIAASTNGELPLSKAKGINLLDATVRNVIAYIQKHATEKVAKKFFAAKQISQPTIQLLANRIAYNIKMMQSKSQPVDGAPSRSVMPQTGDAPEFVKHLKQGMVNFIDPKPSDIQ